MFKSISSQLINLVTIYRKTFVQNFSIKAEVTVILKQKSGFVDVFDPGGFASGAGPTSNGLRTST